MIDGELDVDQWVRWVEGMCYRYSPGDPMMPVIAVEQIKVVDNRGVRVGSIVSMATVVRTRVAGAEVSGDHRVDGCRFGGCGSEGGDVGGCGVRLRTDAVGRDGRKDLGQKLVS